MMSSFTTLSGRRAKKYWIPDAEYGRPRRAGVTAKAAVSSATTKSQLSTRSQAPPHTVPCTMAITAPGYPRTARSSSSSGSPNGRGSTPRTGSSLMSWPADHTSTGVAVRMTTARTPRRSNSCSACISSSTVPAPERVPLGDVVQREGPDLVVDRDLDGGCHQVRPGPAAVGRASVRERRDRRLRFLIRLPQTAMSHHAPRPAWERS